MKANLLLLFGLMPFWAMAQTPTPYDNVPRYDQVPGYRRLQARAIYNERPIPRSVVIKLNPLLAVGVDGAASGGVEVPVGKRGAVQAEFGYGAFRSLMNYDSESYSRKENWRGRLQYRQYVPQGISTDHPAYWAIEGTYKQVNALDNQTLGRDCVNGNCGYFQLVQQAATRYIVGLYGKGGKVIPLTRADGTYRFLVDVYAGFGLYYAWAVRQPLNLPTGGQYPTTDYLFTPYPRLFSLDDRFGKSSQPNRALPDMQLGFTVGYRLNE